MRGWAVATVGLLLLGACERRNPPPPAPSSAPHASAAPARALTAAEQAIVTPLAAGSTLASFTVREIRGVEEGVMLVVCADHGAQVKLTVALAKGGGDAPPAVAGPYAVFYQIRSASPSEGEKLAKALAKVLEANLAAPPPPGMTPFTPKASPGTTL